MLRHECRKVSIFSKRQQILLMQCIDFAVLIFVEYSIRYDQWPAFIGGTEAVHAKAVSPSASSTRPNQQGLTILVNM